MKLLIANRGEIACRILRTAKKMGIPTVAVYAEPDQDAAFVKLADQAYPLAFEHPSQDYLDIDTLISIARTSGATCIHPGYGFLSENAAFSLACEKAGIIFIGPPPAAIEAMGDKRAAKEQMKKANIPIVPGYQGEDQSERALLEAANAIAYPLLIKASAGGGGKGMRVD